MTKHLKKIIGKKKGKKKVKKKKNGKKSPIGKKRRSNKLPKPTYDMLGNLSTRKKLISMAMKNIDELTFIYFIAGFDKKTGRIIYKIGITTNLTDRYIGISNKIDTAIIKYSYRTSNIKAFYIEHLIATYYNEYSCYRSTERFNEDLNLRDILSRIETYRFKIKDKTNEQIKVLVALLQD